MRRRSPSHLSIGQFSATAQTRIAHAEPPHRVRVSRFLPEPGLCAAAADLNDIDMDVPDVFNSGQSQASGSNESRYLVQFGNGDSSLRLAFNRLSPRSTALSPPMRSSCVLRLWSCAGCHRLNNGVAVGGGLVWPKSLGFTHVSEQATEVVDGVTRFVISPAL